MNELEGVGLAEAICKKRNWIYAGGKNDEPVDVMLIGEHSVDIETTCYWYGPGGRLDAAGRDAPDGRLYRPDLNIAQAWELDGEGWRWEFGERGSYLSARVVTERYVIRYALVEWADFPTKAQAYATARCRAFLKAKAAL